jgi:hypothetical protein
MKSDILITSVYADCLFYMIKSEYLLHLLANSSSSVDDLREVQDKLSNQLFQDAMKAIQQRAAINGLIENNSVKLANNTIIGGFMQESNHLNFNSNVNAYYFNIPTAINIQENLPQEQFTENDYHGLSLVSLPNCCMQIINPYSNPFYYGADLVKQLWPAKSTEIPHIYVPIINHKAYKPLIAQYYQAELYRFASYKQYSFADQLTPDHLLYRPARRTLLQLEAIKIYTKLATTVAKLFIPEAQEQIKIKILYRTTFGYMQNLVDNVAEWMQKLYESNHIVANENMDLQYKKILIYIANYVYSSIAIAKRYINNLNANPSWYLEQELGFKNTFNKSVNKPLDENDQQYVITHNLFKIKKIEACMHKAQLNLNNYIRKTQPSNTCMLAAPNSLASVGNIWQLLSQFEQLKRSLQQALNNANIRAQILTQMHDSFNAMNIENHQNIEILNDEQLINIYNYILSQDDSIIKAIFNLAFTTATEHEPIIRFIYERNQSQGATDAKPLIRKTEIMILTNKSRLYLLPGSKASDGSKILPKIKRYLSSITMKFDINPQHINNPSPIAGAGAIDVIKIKSLQKKINVRERIYIAHKMKYIIDTPIISSHYRKDKNDEMKHSIIIRFTDDWIAGILPQIIEERITNHYKLFMMDADYKQVKDIDDQSEINHLQERIILNLIGDMFFDILMLHNTIKAVHGNLSVDKILIYFDKSKRMHARLSDFTSIIFADKITEEYCQPRVTAMYASPEVVEFAKKTNQKLKKSESLPCVAEKKSNNYKCLSFGCELLDNNWNLVKNKEIYKSFKSDYKNDMFSLGVVIFILITNHYPTNINQSSLEGQYAYMQIQEAYINYPQYKELLEGLLKFDANDRFNIEDALQAYQKIPNSLKLSRLSMKQQI